MFLRPIQETIRPKHPALLRNRPVFYGATPQVAHPGQRGRSLTRYRVALVAVIVLGLFLVGAFAWPGFLRRGGPPRGVIVYQGGVVEGGYRLFTIRATGGVIHRVDVPIANESFAFPAFSPDGTKLAFVGEAEGGRQDLFVAAADGADPRSIVQSPMVQVGAPSWSPDGSTLVFSWKRDGNWEIYSVRSDGTALTRLTNDPALDAGATWSRNGRSILFSSDRGGGDSHLYVMNADGTGVKQLTFGDDESAADESRDGRRIVYVGFTSGNADLWTMKPDGTDRRRLTTDAAFEYNPRWSPDGKWIAFEVYRGKNPDPDVFLMRADGSGRRQLTDTGQYAGNPAWFPGRS